MLLKGHFITTPSALSTAKQSASPLLFGHGTVVGRAARHAFGDSVLRVEPPPQVHQPATLGTEGEKGRRAGAGPHDFFAAGGAVDLQLFTAHESAPSGREAVPHSPEPPEPLELPDLPESPDLPVDLPDPERLEELFL